jgi:hypothetical protein
VTIRRPLKLIYLEWEDASGLNVWMDADEVETYSRGHFLVRQVGFVLKETPRYLLIAGQWIPEDDFHDEKFGDVTRIPKTWVRTRRIIPTRKIGL